MESAPAASPKPNSSIATPAKGRLIAVVDDDVSTCRSIERLLRTQHYETITCTSTLAFLESGHLHDTACLILDVNMPGQTGLEFQESLRRTGWHLPIIFITGYIDDEKMDRARRGGARAILEKPFDDAVLLAKIADALSI